MVSNDLSQKQAAEEAQKVQNNLIRVQRRPNLKVEFRTVSKGLFPASTLHLKCGIVIDYSSQGIEESIPKNTRYDKKPQNEKKYSLRSSLKSPLLSKAFRRV